MSDSQNLNDLVVGLLNRVTRLEEKNEVQAQVISTQRTEIEALAQKIIELEEDYDAQSLKNAKEQVNVQDNLKAMELSGMKFMNDTQEGFRKLWKKINRCLKIEQRLNGHQTAINALEELIQTFAKKNHKNGLEIKKLQKRTTHQVPHSSEHVTRLEKRYLCNICGVTWSLLAEPHEPAGEICLRTCKRKAREAISECQSCSKDPMYKTKICTGWKEGNCIFGRNCRFAHGEQELRK